MSVPDWPNTYGYNMFFFPWQDWVGGIFFEHSHRLVAAGVGVLLTILAVSLCFQERIWLRWMGLAVPIFVALEGTLGGLRVVLREDQIGIFHACLAQALFLAVSLMALFTSRWWIGAGPAPVPPQWPGRVLAVTALIFMQLMVGATMRHEHAGLSITDFPTAYGQAWPRTDPAAVAAYNLERLKHNQPPTTPLYINMQMAHRAGGGPDHRGHSRRRRRGLAHARFPRRFCAGGPPSGSGWSSSSSRSGPSPSGPTRRPTWPRPTWPSAR